MASHSADLALIRRYLLRDLDEADEARLDERVLSDQSFFEVVELVEDDIVDEYVRGETPPAARRGVEAFLSTPERQRHVNLTQALARERQRLDASTSPGATRIVASVGHAAGPPHWTRWALLAAAASLMITASASVYFGVQARRLRAELIAAIEPQSEQLRALDRRVSELSAPPLALSFLLIPDISERSSSGPPLVLEVPAGANRLALQLDLAPSRLPSRYDVSIRRVGGPQVWGESGLDVPGGPNAHLTVTVPAAVVRPDDYVVSVSAAGGQQTIEYRFRVASR
jgi:hypothetical protein